MKSIDGFLNPQRHLSHFTKFDVGEWAEIVPEKMLIISGEVQDCPNIINSIFWRYTAYLLQQVK